MIRSDMGAALKLAPLAAATLALRSELLPAVKASLVEALSTERGHVVDPYSSNLSRSLVSALGMLRSLFASPPLKIKHAVAADTLKRASGVSSCCSNETHTTSGEVALSTMPYKATFR